MKQGGTVLFDTRDAIDVPTGPGGQNNGPGMLALRNILSSLDIPELEPVPRDHVLTKTFYLLKDFPGRFSSGQLWVEASVVDPDEETTRPARAGDGVSSILITSNDLAGAWALRPDGQAMLPIVNGEGAPARICVPRRRQHRDVHADRQLQGRPGPYPRAAGAAGAVNARRNADRFCPPNARCQVGDEQTGLRLK